MLTAEENVFSSAVCHLSQQKRFSNASYGKLFRILLTIIFYSCYYPVYMSLLAERRANKKQPFRNILEFTAGVSVGITAGILVGRELRRQMRITSTENSLSGTQRVKARLPEGPQTVGNVQVITEQELIKSVLTDEANFPGGESAKLVRFSQNATEADIARILTDTSNRSFVVRGGGTSLTGASVPKGEVVLDMANMNRIGELRETPDGQKLISVQPGVTIEALQKRLEQDNLFFPSAPTYVHATVGGAVNTDAGGARGYKYGKTREYVQSLKLMLASGEVVEIERGKHIAHPADKKSPVPYFELETAHGEVHIVPVPTYEMPQVPKISAGYYAKKEGMDMLDLVVGSEGTLGVITEVTLHVREEPPTTLLLIPCVDDAQALDLNARLREQEPEKRITREPGGISAVEIMGENAVNLIRRESKIKPPENAGALLLVQVEMPDGKEDSLVQVLETCATLPIPIPDDHILGAMPDDTAGKGRFIAVREAIPLMVNELVRHKGSTKVGTDSCVQPVDLPKLVSVFDTEFGNRGVDYYWWGHGEGNFHCNAIPSQDHISIAREAALRVGERAITQLQGVGTAEHGVGKNAQKQALLKILYGEQGINQMRNVKKAFDYQGKMAPGNIFPLIA